MAVRNDKKVYIGIDLGTSSVKAVAADAGGAVVSSASEQYVVNYPRSGWSEQDPEEWFEATLRALGRLNVSGVAGIACGGQMHGLVALDKEGKVVRPCILWNDGRSAPQTVYLNETVGRQKLAALTGNIAFAGFTAPKLLWLRENEPANFGRIYKILLPKDYIVYRLTGEFVTDYSDASGTLLLDVKNRCWSEQMLGLCGVSRSAMPSLCESFGTAGRLKKDIAGSFGWKDVKVAAGAGDNAAAAVGAGALAEGDCNISLGTSGTAFIPCEKFILPANNALHSFCHADGRWHLMGCILSAASANKWWTEDILSAQYRLPAQAEKELGKNAVFFLPYLMGERCPHNDVKARGAFVGLSAETTRMQMSLAVLEGVAFALKDCLGLASESGTDVTAGTVCGGGAKSGIWLKILANVLGFPLYKIEAGEGAALGAAMLAMTACGEYRSVESAAQAIVRKRLAAEPDKQLAEAYGENYQRYKRLYPLLKDWFV